LAGRRRPFAGRRAEAVRYAFAVTTLNERVESLAADASRGPELQSLLTAEARSVAERLLSDEFEPGTAFTADELVRRIESYEALTAPLGRAWGTLGWWTPPASARGAVGLIGYLAAVRDRGSGIRPWLDLYAYPALLLFYAFGLGASAARRFDNLAVLFDQPVPDARGQLQPAVVELNHPAVIDHDVAKTMPGMQRQLTPFSDRLATTTRPWTPILSDMLFGLEFDRFEFLVGLACYDVRHAEYGNWAPTGRFTWRGRYGGGVCQAMLAELAEPAGAAPLLAAGLFGGSEERLRTALSGYGDLVRGAMGRGL
jgi:hypothetical protein